MASTNPDSLHEANQTARAIFEAGMEQGYHSLRQRLESYLTVSGGATPFACVLHGHHWYLDALKHGKGYQCFCDRCGDGSYFDEIPTEAYDFQYECWRCDAVLDADELIPHWETEHEPEYDPAELNVYERRILRPNETNPFFDRVVKNEL